MKMKARLDWENKGVKIIVGIGLLIVIALSVFLDQNDFNMKVTPVQIPTSHGELSGNLVTPEKAKQKLGLVVFIHGDGPANASYNGQYDPLWEKLAKLGYASLSWSKPGIEGSSGNWLGQTMDDRAKEAAEAIAWARTLPEIDASRIGLWGASQAGWVIPKISKLDDKIAFQILVAPAINWVNQGLYNTLAQMQRDGKSPAEQEQAKADYLWSVSMLEKNATYQEYLKGPKADKNLTEDRWNFILKNYKSDSTKDIQGFYSPVKLFLGGKDINVDSSNTREVFEKEVRKDLLSVTYIPTTDHFMLRKSLVNSKFLTNITAIFAPRQLADREYYNGIEAFLQTVDKNSVPAK